MNKEEIEKQFLFWLQKVLEEGVDLAKAEVPLVLEEFLAYSVIRHGIASAVGLGLLGLALVSARKLLKNRGEMFQNEEGSPLAFFWLTLGLGGLVLGVASLAHNLISFFGAWLAPRGYLLERFLL